MTSPLTLLLLYYIKQIDSMLPCVCSVIDHRRRQNVVRTSVTHLGCASCATFWLSPHFDVICDLFSINLLVFYHECRSLMATLLAIYSVIDSE